MIKSCKACKTKCCRTGPGPHRVVRAMDYINGFLDVHSYNTVCENFNLKTEKCSVWGTYKLPISCRTYVCHARTYTKKELQEMKEITWALYEEE